jgi:hypothetical protein
MSAFSDYMENAILNWIRGNNITAPTTVYVGLASSATTDAHTGATIPELANSNGYARQAVTFGAPSGGANNRIANTAAVNFTASADWVTATHAFITDSATHGAGNVIMHFALTSPVTVLSGQVRQFPIGELRLEVA